MNIHKLFFSLNYISYDSSGNILTANFEIRC